MRHSSARMIRRRLSRLRPSRQQPADDADRRGDDRKYSSVRPRQAPSVFLHVLRARSEEPAFRPLLYLMYDAHPTSPWRARKPATLGADDSCSCRAVSLPQSRLKPRPGGVVGLRITRVAPLATSWGTQEVWIRRHVRLRWRCCFPASIEALTRALDADMILPQATRALPQLRPNDPPASIPKWSPSYR